MLHNLPPFISVQVCQNVIVLPEIEYIFQNKVTEIFHRYLGEMLFSKTKGSTYIREAY